MVYVAPKRIYVSQDRRRIVDPAEQPGVAAFLLVAAGQSLDDATAEALGLTGGGEGEANEDVIKARTLHMPATAFGYTETGSIASGMGGSTPVGPGGLPVQSTGGTTTAPGGLAPGDVERVQETSGVARSTAANLAAADAQSRMGYEAQIVSEAALRAESEAQPHGTNVVGQSREPNQEAAQAAESVAEEHARAAEELARAGQGAAVEAVEAGDPRREQVGGAAQPQGQEETTQEESGEGSSRRGKRSEREEADEKKK